MAVFKGGRWRGTRTGRFVKRVTVAKQLEAPRSAVKLTVREPKRYVEVTAVCRVRLPDRYIESLQRRVLKSPTKREIRQVKARLRKEARRQVKRNMGGEEQGKYRKLIRKGTREEVRRRVKRAASEHKVEVRPLEGSKHPKDWSSDKQSQYASWWEGLTTKARATMRSYLPVGTVAWLDEMTGEDDEDLGDED